MLGWAVSRRSCWTLLLAFAHPSGHAALGGAADHRADGRPPVLMLVEHTHRPEQPVTRPPLPRGPHPPTTPSTQPEPTPPGEAPPRRVVGAQVASGSYGGRSPSASTSYAGSGRSLASSSSIASRMCLRIATRGSRSVQLEVGVLRAELVAQLVLRRLGQLAQLADQPARLAGELREPVGTEDHDRDHQDHRQLGQTDPEHGSVSTFRAGASGRAACRPGRGHGRRACGRSRSSTTAPGAVGSDSTIGLPASPPSRRLTSSGISAEQGYVVPEAAAQGVGHPGAATGAEDLEPVVLALGRAVRAGQEATCSPRRRRRAGASSRPSCRRARPPRRRPPAAWSRRSPRRWAGAGPARSRRRRCPAAGRGGARRGRPSRRRRASARSARSSIGPRQATTWSRRGLSIPMLITETPLGVGHRHDQVLDLGGPGVGDAEHRGHRVAVDVGVDDADLQALLGHRERQVDGDRGLADAALAGGDRVDLGQRAGLARTGSRAGPGRRGASPGARRAARRSSRRGRGRRR